MRSVTIKISADGKTEVSGSNLLGYGGEHNASSLTFQLDSDALLHFEGAEYYRVAVDGAFSDSLQLESDNVVFKVPGDMMVPPSVNVQLIGYKHENDELVLVAKCAVTEVEVGFSEEYKNDSDNQPDVFDRYVAACENVYEQAKAQVNFAVEYALKATEQAEISTVAAARSENAAESADVFAGVAEQHSLSAKDSADAAQIYAEQGKSTLDEFKSINFPPEVYANALKGSLKGEIVAVRDVSPLTHTLDVSIEGEVPYETVVISEEYDIICEKYIEFEGRRKIDVEYILGCSVASAYIALTSADLEDQCSPVSDTYIELGAADASVHGRLTIYIEGSKVCWNGVKTITSENDEQIYFEGSTDIGDETHGGLYDGDALINGLGILNNGVPYLKVTETVEGTVTVKTLGKNFLRYPYDNKTLTTNGIKYTVNTDGSLTVEGTSSSSGNANFNFALTTNPILLKAGTYTFSVGKMLTQPVSFRIGKVVDGKTYLIGTIQYAGQYQTKITFTLEEDTDIYINCIVGSGKVIEKETFYPQIELGSAMTDFEPYKFAEYTPNADGTVEGVKSIYPVTTLLTEAEGVTINAEYNKDTNKVIESLVNAIIALGGNV